MWAPLIASLFEQSMRPENPLHIEAFEASFWDFVHPDPMALTGEETLPA